MPDTLLTGFTSLLATMESATDLEQVRPAAQTCGRLPDIGSPGSGCDGAGMPESPVAKLTQAASGERGDHMTLDDFRRPSTPRSRRKSMHKKHDTQESRAVDSETEPRCTRNRSHTRSRAQHPVKPTRTCNKLLGVYM